MTLKEVIAQASAAIADSGHAARPRREAEELALFVLGCDRTHLYAHPEREIEGDPAIRLRTLVAQRCAGTPIAYLTGRAEFCDREFEVGPGVLIPRPETEMIVALARAETPSRVLDVGTGSGALAVTLSLEHDTPVTAADISRPALEVAARNGRRFDARLQLVQADGLDAFADASFDLIVANPPYVDPADRETLPVEVRDHEPPSALFSPAGLEHLRAWITGAARVLSPGGRLLFEIGYGQSEEVRALATAESELTDVTIHPDFQNIPRVLDARRIRDRR